MLTINDDTEAQVWGAVYAAMLAVPVVVRGCIDTQLSAPTARAEADAAVLALRERRKAVAK